MNIQEVIEQNTKELRLALGEHLQWKFDPRFEVLLSEFAQNKSEAILEQLRTVFTDEWHVKTAKYLPKELKTALGDLSKVSKNQLILSKSGDDKNSTIVALWWPWGHGSTYSLRLKVVDQAYHYQGVKKSPSAWQRLGDLLFRR